MTSALQPGPVAIDACSLINLYAASGSIQGLFGLGFKFHLSPVVQREALFVRVGGTGPDADQRQPVDIRSAIALGAIIVTPFSGPAEEQLFICFAQSLDDGEAAACALAVSRGIPLLSDDRAAIRLLTRPRYAATVLDTPAIVKYWFDAASVGPPAAGEIIRQIMQRASFTPPANHPLRAWWDLQVQSWSWAAWPCG